MRAQGWSIQAIGQTISVSPKTVRRLLNRATPPSQEYVHHRRVPWLVEPFLPYLLQRWADGCRNGRQLTREIEELGYQGKGSSVRWMIARWRPPKTPRQPRRRLLTRHVPWLLLRAPDLLKDEERVDLRDDPPEEVLREWPTCWAGPQWVRGKDVDQADELWDAIEGHRKHLEATGRGDELRRQRLMKEIEQMVSEELKQRVASLLQTDSVVDDLSQRRIDPYRAAAMLVDRVTGANP